MALKNGNSRRVAKSHPVCMDLDLQKRGKEYPKFKSSL